MAVTVPRALSLQRRALPERPRGKEDMTNASEFAEQKERLKAARKARYEADVTAKRGRRVPGGPAPPDAADADGPLQPLCNKFYAEWDALYTFHKENKDALAKGPGKFGEPLAPWARPAAPRATPSGPLKRTTGHSSTFAPRSSSQAASTPPPPTSACTRARRASIRGCARA